MKAVLIFPGTKLSSSNIYKKLPTFSQMKTFLYFSKHDPALFSPSPRNKRTPPQKL